MFDNARTTTFLNPRMENEFQRLKLGDLSTVHELDEKTTLTNDNVRLLQKQKLLSKYIDENSKGGDFGDEDFDFEDDRRSDNAQEFDFDQRVIDKLNSQNRADIQTDRSKNTQNQFKPGLKTPTSNHILTLTGHKQRPASLSSFSTRTHSSSHSQYSETDTENSDYAADYDISEEEQEKMNLVDVFQRKQIEAKQQAEKLRQKNAVNAAGFSRKDLQRSNKLTSQYSARNEYLDDLSNDRDFNSIANLDVSKLDRFNNNNNDVNFNSLSTIGRKKSLPAMIMGTSLNGSPKKLKRYSSSVEMNSVATLQSKLRPSQQEPTRESRYPVFTGNELDDVADFDLTVTLSDYRKLKKKSQKFDISKYAENSTHGTSKYNTKGRVDSGLVYLTPKGSQTAKLTKEGKIRLIRSLGKPKVRKVMPAHLYGEIIYDPQLKKWCGNEEDLVRFDSINHPKPQLINQSNNKIPQVVGSMVYDDKKLRWVSVTGVYEDDPFDDDFDATIHRKEQNDPTYSLTPRGVSGRLVPSESTISLGDHLKKKENYYKVTPSMYKIWKIEEERWVRKVGNWFPNDEDPHAFKYDLKVFLNQQ